MWNLSNLKNLTSIGGKSFQQTGSALLVPVEVKATDLTNLTTLQPYSFSQAKVGVVDFSGCTSLNFTSTEYVFYKAASMTSINFTNCPSINYIAPRMFRECTSLATIIDWETIKQKITEVRIDAFAFASASAFDFLRSFIGATVMFFSTVIFGNRLKCWNTMPIF